MEDPILSESAQSLLSSAVNSSSIGSLNMLEPANITIDGDGDTMSIKIDINQGTLANLTGITRNGGGYGLDLDNAYLEGYLVCPDVLNSNNDYDFKAFGIIAPDDNTFILNFE